MQLEARFESSFPKRSVPQRTWIGVSALAVSDFLIEIEATAVLE